MGLVIALSKLKSRITRKAITGQEGIRRFAESGIIPRTSGNVTETFWDGLARFGASLLAVVTWKPPWLNLNFSTLWSNIIQGYNFLWNFNWNSTNAQLDAQLKQAEIALRGAIGGAKGSFVGFLVCGVAPAATIAVFNEALALYVLKNVSEEAAQEIAGKIAAVLDLQTRKTANTAFINLFKNNRSLMRNAALSAAKFLSSIGIPIDDEQIRKANEKRDRPWSLATAMEDSIDNIADPAVKAETEEFWEEFGEACIEAGYIVANSLDSWFLQQRIIDNENSTNEDIVIINPSGAISTSSNP